MAILSVTNLCKTYPKFFLDNISFSLERGFIMGFIGRNGAGKTTTLKSMLGLVHPDSGEVKMNDLDFSLHEFECKQNIGFVLGGVDYFPKKKISTITDVTKRFYPQWDEEAYLGYLARFELDPDKRVDELSAGMRVKYSLALALSHHADLLILDEPTSGLDPVSRDDLLDLFQELIQDGERSILFSTHITSDLERCADYITYIKDGKLLFSEEKDTFMQRYHLIGGNQEQLFPDLEKHLVGLRKHRFGFEAMIPVDVQLDLSGFEISKPNLEAIMVHLERE